VDATQFQAAVLAWGAAATTLIGVLVALGLALRGAVAQLTAKHVENATAIASVTAVAATHERQLNGDLTPRIEAIADQRIAVHRRPGDTAFPVGPTSAPPA
jgi:hypothetical protein